MPRLLVRPLALLAALLALGVREARAQAGAAADILTGRVTGPDGRPLAGAQVEATSALTRVTRARPTDEQGRFTILFPDGGGRYLLTVRYVGLSARRLSVARQADEDRLEVDVALAPSSSRLGAVVVRGDTRQAGRADAPASPGAIERVLDDVQLQRLPIDPTNAASIALLLSGVVAVDGTDSTSAGFSVAGQRPDQNLVTLDGLSFGAGALPREALRGARVITSTWDVGRGRFTGGEVAMTSRGGTNRLIGSVGVDLNDPRLQFTGDDSLRGSTLAQGYTQRQLSAGLGGPIVGNRAFWFGAVQARRRADPLQSLLDASAYTLRQLGARPDSAARFLSLVQGYGIPLATARLPHARLADNLSGLARVDWHLADNHTLLLRGNAQTAIQRAWGIGALGLPSRGSEQRSWGAGGLLALTSVVGRFVNEAKAFYARDGRDADPYLDTPAGQVRVSSLMADGTTAVTALDFGGSAAAVTSGGDGQLEIADELAWLSRGGAHRLELGALLDRSDFAIASAANRLGTFTFNSLADLEDNLPARYTRTLASRERAGRAAGGAVYLGDTWRRERALQLTYGVRAEYGGFARAPDYNPEVERLFGRRTDRVPADLAVTPRAGFSWTPGARAASNGRRGPPATTVRGGIGAFRGRTPVQLLLGAMDATGLPGAQEQLVCIGDQIPVPDWSAYLADPRSAPATCADGGRGASVASSQRPAVSLFDPAFVAPRVWRGSLGAQRRVGARTEVSVDLGYARGRHSSGARDLNLAPAPAFSLSAEGGRPVYVPASTIAPTTGATSVLASRRHPELAQVMEQRSDLGSRTTQATVSASGELSRADLAWTLAYSYTRSADETTFPSGGSLGALNLAGPIFAGAGGGFGFGQPTTAGDPNAAEWGTSDLERRHAAVGTMRWGVWSWLDLTSIMRLSSGAPFSPRVGGDINGDGARNDRAFVYDPASAPDPAIADGMTRLLASAPARVRRCLLDQLGTIAGRNSCRTGWSARLDLQANLRPDLGPALGRRLAFSVSLVNPLAGLDRLVHGSEGLRGWGQPEVPDATLLYVTGFDPGAGRYRYQVNERFGGTRSARLTTRNAFQIAVQGRLQVATGRSRAMPPLPPTRLDVVREVGRLGLAELLARAAPNAAAEILARCDTLGLTGAQVARLTRLASAFAARNQAILAELHAAAEREWAARGARPDAVLRALAPRFRAAHDGSVAALARARAVLTAAQRAKLGELKSLESE